VPEQSGGMRSAHAAIVFRQCKRPGQYCSSGISMVVKAGIINSCFRMAIVK